MSIGVNIKKIRESRNLTISELSIKSKVGKSTISEIETGKAKNPQAETISKLATALGVSTDYLLGNESENSEIDINKKQNLSPEVETIAAHLEGKSITPKKMKLLKSYIDTLFDDFDE